MSSIIVEKKPRKPRTLKLSNSGPNLSKKVLSNITLLSTYNSVDPLIQQQINLIQSNYKSREIKNFSTAKKELDILTLGSYNGKVLPKKILSNITSLSNYNSTKPLNQQMIKLVQILYKSRTIKNFKTADMALNLLTSNNDFNKFQTLFNKITKTINNSTEKTAFKKDIKQQKSNIKMKEIINKVEKLLINLE